MGQKQQFRTFFLSAHHFRFGTPPPLPVPLLYMSTELVNSMSTLAGFIQ
jgi:hypothetical protein